MRRISSIAIILCLLVGCSAQPPATEKAQTQPPKQVVPPDFVIGKPIPIPVPQPMDLPAPTEGSRAEHEQEQTALREALALVAERKLDDALAVLQAAKATLVDSTVLRTEIDRLQLRMQQQQDAEQTVQAIQAVLQTGNAPQAAKLAQDALAQYGGSEAAEPLSKLKLQADALVTAQLAGNLTKYQAFKQQADAAAAQKNLRGEVLALEQALQYGEDQSLRARYEKGSAALTAYDQNRAQAAELRKDPMRLEDALVLLTRASEAWDTFQIRSDLDEYRLALQTRRDRVALADFEVRGEVGIPEAARVLSDELLPSLRQRFDVVERAQLAKLLTEMKLEPRVLAESELQQRELGRAAGAHFLIVGSVTRLGGWMVHARLVDVRTGLIVQTAKLIAGTPEDLLARMPLLGKALLMSDQERVAWEQQQLQQVVQAPEPVNAQAVLAPPPQEPAAEAVAPPPVLLARAPAQVGFGDKDLEALPAPPEDAAPLLAVPPQAEAPVKQRMLRAAVMLGDDLFRAGRYREAQRQYELALQLAPYDLGVRTRLERIALLVPPPVVYLNPPPRRERIAVLDFLPEGNPAIVPPWLGPWTAEQLAPYFASQYDLVDRAEVYWWMSRMGIGWRDLIYDAAARRWLGRALNVRYFVLGSLRETASFNATAHLLDAETGYRHGRGQIHVRNPHELKLRLGELAQRVQLAPLERARYDQEQREIEQMLAAAQRQAASRDYGGAEQQLQAALKVRVGNVQILVNLNKVRGLAEQSRLEAQRQRDYERMQAEARAYQQRQLELAREAELAKAREAERWAALADAQRREEEERRRQAQLGAQQQMVAQAQLAFKVKNFKLSIQLFEGAVRFQPQDELYRDLARARAEAEREAQLAAAREAAAREAAVRAEREREQALLAAQLEKQRAAVQVRVNLFEVADGLRYQKLLDQGQRFAAQGKHDEAVSAFQAARRLRRTEEVERLLTAALVTQAQAVTRARGEQERLALEQQLREEQQRRIQAEAQAKATQDKYQLAVKLAREAIAARQFDAAIARYDEAGTYFKSDIVLTGLKEARAAKARALADARAEEERAAKEQKKQERFQALLVEGQSALAAKQYTQAVQAYTAAKLLQPGNLDALTGLTKAEQLRATLDAEVRSKAQEEERQRNFEQLRLAGQKSLSDKQYSPAITTLKEALKLRPGDALTLQLLKSAEQARDASFKDAAARAAAKKREDDYQKLLTDGRLALASKQYDLAIQKLGEAQKLLPGGAAADFLNEATKAKYIETAQGVAEAKKKADALERQKKTQDVLARAQAALTTKDYTVAQKALLELGELAPQHPQLARLRQELQAAQSAATAEETARKLQKAKFDTLLLDGRTSLQAGKLEIAVKSLQDAVALMPQDTAAQALLKQAQKAKLDADTAASAAKIQQEEKKRQSLYQEAVKAGQTALTAKKYDVAIKAFDEALVLMPKDAAALALLKQAQDARTAAAGAATAELQKKQQYEKHVKDGIALFTGKKYDDALKAFSSASALQPGDVNLQGWIKLAEKQRDDEKLKLDSEAKLKLQEQKKKTDFDQLLQQGRKALFAKKYDDAVAAFSDASALFPGDAMARKLLNEARDAKMAVKTPPIPDPMPKPMPKPMVKLTPQEIKAQLQLATTLEKDKKYAELVKIYEAVVFSDPRDFKTKFALDAAKYNMHMQGGQEHAAAKRWPDAVREYEAALLVRPRDLPAIMALQRAKKMMP